MSKTFFCGFQARRLRRCTSRRNNTGEIDEERIGGRRSDDDDSGVDTSATCVLIMDKNKKVDASVDLDDLNTCSVLAEAHCCCVGQPVLAVLEFRLCLLSFFGFGVMRVPKVQHAALVNAI